VRGIEAIIEPLLAIRIRGDARPDLGGVQAVLCTSSNGVRALARLSPERRIPLFAVGDATAGRASSEGFAHVESAAGDVVDLVRLVRQRLRPEGGLLLHVCGSVIAGDLAGELQAAGFTVGRSVLYEAAPATSLSAAAMHALHAGLVDFALLFSPRTAAIFARLAQAAGAAESLRHVRAVSISNAADATLSGLRFRERRVAARPNQESLLAVLDQFIDQRCCA
jgi:uroporphyrinogen-III synthase